MRRNVSIHDIDGDLDALPLGAGADQGADLLGNAALPPDDLTHVVGGDAQLQVSS